MRRLRLPHPLALLAPLSRQGARAGLPLSYSPFKNGPPVRHGRPDELVDRHHIAQTIAAIDQDASISGEARGITADGNHALDLRLRQHACLPSGAGTRRVEDDAIEFLQIIGRQGRLVEIADGRRYPAGKLKGDSGRRRARPRPVGDFEAATFADLGQWKVNVPQPA